MRFWVKTCPHCTAVGSSVGLKLFLLFRDARPFTRLLVCSACYPPEYRPEAALSLPGVIHIP